MIEYEFKQTDAGRAQSKRPRSKNDCTVRALAHVTGATFDQAYDYLKTRGRQAHQGAFFPNRAADDFALGFDFIWKSFPAVRGQKRMNPVTFTKQFPEGTFIARTAGHVFAVIDGVVHDTSPERPDRCIYGAWEVK